MSIRFLACSLAGLLAMGCARDSSSVADDAKKAREYARLILADQQPFAFDFSLPDLEGKTVKLKDFAGKVLIADFWGTWCPPCRMEIPHFVALQEKYGKDGLEVVGLTYENGAGDQVINEVRSFASKNKVTYPLLIGDETTMKQVPDFKAFPTTLFIDRTGKVRLVLPEYHPLEVMEAIVTVLLDEDQRTASR